jgi:hypothetical protein
VIGTIVPKAQAVVASAAAAKNLIAGLTGLKSLVNKSLGLNVFEILAADIGGFEFDYIGEQNLQAGADATEHYTADNFFIQDHVTLKPVTLVCKGFVGELSQTRSSSFGLFGLGALQAALLPVTPYINQYSPGTGAKMNRALTKTNSVLNKLGKIMNLAGSIAKLVAPKFFPTKIQQAYRKLKELRDNKIPIMVKQPYDRASVEPFRDMLITNVQIVSPEDSRGITDVTVTLTEIRFARTPISPSNSRVSGGDSKSNQGATNGSSVAQGTEGASGGFGSGTGMAAPR